MQQRRVQQVSCISRGFLGLFAIIAMLCQAHICKSEATARPSMSLHPAGLLSTQVRGSRLASVRNLPLVVKNDTIPEKRDLSPHTLFFAMAQQKARTVLKS
jgi:hypothetical protein